MRLLPFLLLLLPVLFLGCQSNDHGMSKAYRFDQNGWIYVHLEGSPQDIGYQHGYLLADEIEDNIKSTAFFLTHESGKNWDFYRNAAKTMFWPKIDTEYQQELGGIAEGLKAKGKSYDVYDLVALNGNIELSQYYVPYLANLAKPGSSLNKAPGNCSGFVATGSYTTDGKIAIGHNNWTDYMQGERWNVVADIVPTKGNRIFMDMMPGFIHSGDDFVINGGGLLITETTITQFNGFDTTQVAEFVRARKAEQYANNIDDFVRIMSDGNNGGYANDWLVGDMNGNEIARVELGLKHVKVWRTHDGVYYGSNFASDSSVIKDETNFNPNDTTSSPNARRRRWEALTTEYKGKINDSIGRVMEGDNLNALSGTKEASRCVLAGSIDTDPKGSPEWSWGPYYPGGTVQGKITTADMAKKFQFWAHMGNPSGKDFLAAPFLTAHPEYQWEASYLHDMKAYPWTLFTAGETAPKAD
jgi:hypothetical protein